MIKKDVLEWLKTIPEEALNSYFIQAVYHDSIENIELFIEAGANINAENGIALKYVIREKRFDVLDLFFKHGAKVQNIEVFLEAVLSKIEILEKVYRHTPKDLLDDFLALAMYKYISIRVSSLPEKLWYLISIGANIHWEDDSMLQKAVTNNDINAVRVLVTAGADIHAKNDVAIKIAERRNLLEIQKILKEGLKNDETV